MKEIHPAIISAIQARIVNEIDVKVNVKFASGLWEVARFTCPEIEILEARLLKGFVDTQSECSKPDTAQPTDMTKLVNTVFEMMQNKQLGRRKAAKVLKMMSFLNRNSIEIQYE